VIWELAQIDIKPGQEAAFEAAVAQAVAIFKRNRGYRALQLHRGIEQPGRYRLLVEWETVEDHTVDFRNSSDFQEWRKLVGHHFAATPVVDHMECVLSAK
jgi:heme-degrading monooxygenase HmoA